MTFTAVGTIVQTSTTSLTVNPTAVGNFFLVEIFGETNSLQYCTSISGGNCTWVQLGTVYNNSVNWASAATVLFIGTATATGSATATLTFNGGPPTFRCAGQQFSSTAGSWALDGIQGNLDSAGTSTWPSLTPAASGELYFGFANNSATATAGSTTGYTYQVDSHGNGMAYNAACTAGAQAPAWADSAQLYGIMVLVKETGAAFTAPPNRPRGQAVNRASTY